MNRAVDSAKTAYKSWRGYSGMERGKILRQTATIIRVSVDIMVVIYAYNCALMLLSVTLGCDRPAYKLHGLLCFSTKYSVIRQAEPFNMVVIM